MSSTLTCFQPPVHTVAHMYSHSDMDPHHPYSNDGYSSYPLDSRFPVNSDANSYSPHAEDLYDEVHYNRSPPGLGSPEFEDTEEVFQYDHMQNKHANCASPQLLCPRPTVPHAQNSPQFAWSEWPNEAPVNAYQVYSEPSGQGYTGSNLHSPQAHETPYTYENQQSTLDFYPGGQEFAEATPNQNQTPRYHGDIQQPFFEPMPPFERDLTQETQTTNMNARYYAAHQPIPPEQRSSYSELAPNLSFMSSQAQHSPPRQGSTRIRNRNHYTPKDTGDDVITRTSTPSRDIKKNPYALGLDGPPLTSIGRKVSATLPIPPNHAPVVNTTPPPSATTTKTKSSRSVNEPRRPSLACTFCRERKIACGRPPDGSEDLTCNQCARRSFRCRYLDSSLKSSPLVLSRASSKDSSSSRKRK